MQFGADALQEHVATLIPAWCTDHGFGSDLVTVSTFTELAAKLLSSLPGALSMASVGPDVRLSDEDSVPERTIDRLANNNAVSPFAQGEDPRASRGQQQDGPAQAGS
jgi:hypothetical protein